MLTGDVAADRAALDAWAAKRTGGLVDRMPVELTDGTEVVLASALGLRADWLRRFRDRPTLPETGLGGTACCWACAARACCWTGSAWRTHRMAGSPS